MATWTDGVLSVSGTTNLIDQTTLAITVGDPGAEERFVAVVSNGAYSVRSPLLLPQSGTYRVAVDFALERQVAAVQAELNFQPRRLQATSQLQVPPAAASWQTQEEHRRELSDLFAQLNQLPDEPETLCALDNRALELSRQLRLGDQALALRRLRQALEEAQRPNFSRDKFERLLLEAHVLAGL